MLALPKAQRGIGFCHLEPASALIDQHKDLKDLGFVGIHFLSQFEVALGVFLVAHTNILEGERDTLV